MNINKELFKMSKTTNKKIILKEFHIVKQAMKNKREQKGPLFLIFRTK